MNLKENQDCLEESQRKPPNYIATYQSSILLWEEQAAEAITNGNKPWLSDARCHLQRLKELLQAFEARNKPIGMRADGEIKARLNELRREEAWLQAELSERNEAKKASAFRETGFTEQLYEKRVLAPLRRQEEADRLEAAKAAQVATPPPTLEEIVQGARNKTSYGYPGLA